MNKQTIKDQARQQVGDRDCLDPVDLLINDVYLDDEPLTLERRRDLGWPTTLEEARARMEAEARKQAGATE